MNIIGSVKDMRVILFDDIVDTAGSLCEAANALVEKGGAKEIYACASHGVLSGESIERIEKSVIKEVIFSDTIPYGGERPCDKIKYLTAAPLFAEAISRIFEEVSISTLFR
jgi:ribose-phosphate pyrophosphokinase